MVNWPSSTRPNNNNNKILHTLLHNAISFKTKQYLYFILIKFQFLEASLFSDDLRSTSGEFVSNIIQRQIETSCFIWGHMDYLKPHLDIDLN
jgi:hypothetical protein